MASRSREPEPSAGATIQVLLPRGPSMERSAVVSVYIVVTLRRRCISLYRSDSTKEVPAWMEVPSWGGQGLWQLRNTVAWKSSRARSSSTEGAAGEVEPAAETGPMHGSAQLMVRVPFALAALPFWVCFGLDGAVQLSELEPWRKAACGMPGCFMALGMGLFEVVRRKR